MRRSGLWANLATLANGAVGVGAILYTLAGNELWAMLLIVSGLGFDGLDGWLHRRSGLPGTRFGRVADSVSDSVTFGLAPAALLFYHPYHAALWSPYATLSLVAAVVVATLAIARLVWFTVRAFHHPNFIGAPTPQNALGLVILVLFFDVPAFFGTRPVLVLFVALVLAATMVLPIPFPKMRRGSPLRGPMTLTGIAIVVALLPLQFAPSMGSPLYEVAYVAAIVAAVGIAAYYLIGPWTVPPPTDPHPVGVP